MSNSAAMTGSYAVTIERHMALTMFLSACVPRQASDDNLATSNMIATCLPLPFLRSITPIVYIYAWPWYAY